ncbi:hypothetical protein SEA_SEBASTISAURUS_49 [Streptomyces phage Sebastisaurus]|uniref:Uncharacterized protein n=1 Tax=Streptomyces phage Sebastisaurus TaxID=2510572 RepID=A0A411B3W2_9CAUD|nr:hypothetical protein SEA_SEBASTISAURUS_49 [Streptomyces phage Sebastisaurus]
MLTAFVVVGAGASAYPQRMDIDDDFMAGPIGPKTKSFTTVAEILAKLEGKAALWERTARDNKERAEDFERAAQQIREGSTSVTVGRTTYTLTDDQTTTRDETADETVS